MSNKVYKDKRKKSTNNDIEEKKNKQQISPAIKELVIIFTMVVITILISTIPLPWSIYKPGGAINIDEKLKNKKYIGKGNINMSYLAFSQGTVSSLVAGLILPSWDIVNNDDITYEGQDMKETDAREHIDMYKAISDATMLAYKEANIPLEIINQEFHITSVSDKEASNLQVGDIILSYDGRMIASTSSFKEYINSLDVGDIIKFKVRRDDKTRTVESRIIKNKDEKLLGIGIETINNYPKDTVIYTPDESESGPSCGLMLTLAIYNSLIKEDLTRGKKICGTGTISSDGTVGKIGGIKYKLIGSEVDGCDIFFVPKENYKEATSVIKENNLKLKHYKISTFKEAVEILKQ